MEIHNCSLCLLIPDFDHILYNDTPILHFLSAYDAQVAGLYYFVNPSDTGFQVCLHFIFK